MNSTGRRAVMSALAAGLLAGLPATAGAAANWGYGPPGKSSATITWQPDNGRDVTALEFTLAVKVKSARPRLGKRCTVSRAHPKRVRCAIAPAAAYGYIDLVATAHIPCGRAIGFRVKPVGKSYFVRQAAIPSGNACS
jgi:hypothetical protein